MATIKVRRNIWGNICGYENGRRVAEFGESEFDAREWASNRLLKDNCQLSIYSEVKMAEIEKHRESLK